MNAEIGGVSGVSGVSGVAEIDVLFNGALQTFSYSITLGPFVVVYEDKY
jgi:hypothetical protein